LSMALHRLGDEYCGKRRARIRIGRFHLDLLV
jgi:hypothetical protein